MGHFADDRTAQHSYGYNAMLSVYHPTMRDVRLTVLSVPGEEYPGATMIDTNKINYISDEAGHRSAAIVPIDVWREIESEIETRYLLDNPAMRKRLLEAVSRSESISLSEATQRLGVSVAESGDAKR